MIAAGLGVAVLLGSGTVALQWRTNRRLEQQRSELAGERADLRGAGTDAERGQVLGAPGAEAAQAAKIRRATEEVSALEARVAAAQAAAAAKRDPQQSLVPLEQFCHAGRATPAAAVQTMVWAIMSGDDAALAESIAVKAADRAEAAAFLASLPAGQRAKTPTPEHLVGLFFARETLQKVVALQVLDPIPGSDAQHVTLPVRAMEHDERVSTKKLPMELGSNGWQLSAPAGMVGGIRKALQRSSRGPDQPASPAGRQNGSNDR
jgi:hypothetical protein